MKKIFATIWLLALGCQIQPAAAWTVVNNICNAYPYTVVAAHIEGGQCASCLKNDYAAGATASCPDGDNGCGRSNGYFISVNQPGPDQAIGCPYGVISGDSQMQITGMQYFAGLTSTINGVNQGQSEGGGITNNSGAVTGNPCNNYPCKDGGTTCSYD